MAIAVDASTPARWSGTPTAGTPATSASFTAPTDALLVCLLQSDGTGAQRTGNTLSITDSGGLTWTNQVQRTWAEATDGGESSIWTARTTSSVSRTVDIVNAGSSYNGRASAKLYVLTGVDVDGTPVDTVGASNEGGTNTDPTNTSNVTPGANGLLLVSACDWNQTGTGTSSNLTLDMADYSGAITTWAGYRTSTSGVALNGNLNPPATPQFKWCQITVREAAGGGGGATPPPIIPRPKIFLPMWSANGLT